jgi:putative flippase GtrA
MKILLLQKFKFLNFLVISVTVTTIDYLIFFSFYRHIGILTAHIISYVIAIFLSFTLQKKFVFEPTRKTPVALMGVFVFSLIGISLGYTVLYVYNRLFGSIVMAKVLMTVTMFFYNFYSKKFAFGDRT